MLQQIKHDVHSLIKARNDIDDYKAFGKQIGIFVFFFFQENFSKFVSSERGFRFRFH